MVRSFTNLVRTLFFDDRRRTSSASRYGDHSISQLRNNEMCIRDSSIILWRTFTMLHRSYWPKALISTLFRAARIHASFGLTVSGDRRPGRCMLQKPESQISLMIRRWDSAADPALSAWPKPLRATCLSLIHILTKEGDYTFKVRTVPHTDDEKRYGDKSGWVESGDLYIDADEVSDGTGKDTGSGTGAGGGITEEMCIRDSRS